LGKASDGYCIQFGGNSNTNTKLAKDGKDLLILSAPLVEPGRIYTFSIERVQQDIRFFIDGELAFEFRDFFPLPGLCVGFYTWGEGAHFSDLKVESLGLSSSVSILALPNYEFLKGRFQEAERLYLDYSHAFKDREEGWAATFKLGLCRIERENFEGAGETFKSLLQTPWEPQARFGLIRALASGRQVEELLSHREICLEKYPKHEANDWIEAHLKKTLRRYLDLGWFEEAALLASELLSGVALEKEKDLEVAEGYLKALGAANQADKLIAVAGGWLLQPLETERLVQLARITSEALRTTDRAKDTVVLLNRCQEKKKADLDFFCTLQTLIARHLNELGDTRAAFDRLETLLALPEAPEARKREAVALKALFTTRLGDFDGASRLLLELQLGSHAVEIDREAIDIGLHTLALQGRFEEAERIVRSVLETIDPGSPNFRRFLTRLGDYQFERGLFREAKQVYEEVNNAFAPTTTRRARGRLDVAKCLIQLDQTDHAERELNALIAQAPDARAVQAEALLLLGEIALINGKQDKAFEYLSRQLEEYPEFQDSHFEAFILGGKLNLYVGEYNDSKEWFEEALRTTCGLPNRKLAASLWLGIIRERNEGSIALRPYFEELRDRQTPYPNAEFIGAFLLGSSREQLFNVLKHFPYSVKKELLQMMYARSFLMGEKENMQFWRAAYGQTVATGFWEDLIVLEEEEESAPKG